MAGKSIYLAMDLMNDLVHADGPNGKGPLRTEAVRRRVLENTAAVLAKARAARIPVGFVRVGFSEGYGECSTVSPRFREMPKHGILKLGTWGTQIHEAVKPQAGEFDIVKHRISPFYGTSLEVILRANAITRIYLSGVSTNFVVNSGVREGHDRDYEIVVVEDCCSAGSQEEHDAALSGFRSLCTDVTTSGDLAFQV